MAARKKTAAKAKAKKSTAKAPARKKAATPKASAKKATKKKAPAKAEGVSSLGMNMGHVMILKPRVPKAFRPKDLQEAKLLLQDEAYANIQEAARAVVERALELARKGPPKRGFRR